MSSEDVKKVIGYGTIHLEFFAKLYQMQIDHHLYFLHEHPHAATSWENKAVKKLLEQDNVIRIQSHMCAFGMQEEDQLGKEFVKKPTGFMISAPELARRSELPCN